MAPKQDLTAAKGTETFWGVDLCCWGKALKSEHLMSFQPPVQVRLNDAISTFEQAQFRWHVDS